MRSSHPRVKGRPRTLTRAGGRPQGPVAELTVESLAPGGEGVAREGRGAAEGRVVFVPGVAPGDRVRVRLVQQKARWARGELLEVVEAGPDRVAPFCPIRDACGGCPWQHVTVEAQRAAKHAMVQRIADRLAGGGGGLVVPPIVGGPDRAWRHRARLRFAVGDQVVLGFFGARSHDLVDAPECAMLQAPVRHGMDALRAALASLPAGAQGTAIVSADAAGGAHVAVRLEGAPGEALARSLRPLAGAVVEAPDGTHRHGDRLDVPQAPGLRVRPGGFTQANPQVFAELVADLVAEVRALAPASVLDLFAGAGTLTLPLARLAPTLALEASEDAVADLRANLEALARIVHRPTGESLERPANSGTSGEGRPEACPRHVEDDTRSRGPKALAALRSQPRGGETCGLDPPVDARAEVADLAAPGALAAHVDATPDVVVLDPPREGAAALTPELLALAPPAVVYVSCDPQTQARDLAALAPAYELVSLRAYDAFPHTPHVETLAVLRQRPSAK